MPQPLLQSTTASFGTGGGMDQITTIVNHTNGYVCIDGKGKTHGKYVRSGDVQTKARIHAEANGQDLSMPWWKNPCPWLALGYKCPIKNHGLYHCVDTARAVSEVKGCVTLAQIEVQVGTASY